MRALPRILLMIISFVLASAIPAFSSNKPAGSAFAWKASDAIAPFIIVGELSLLTDGHEGVNEAVQGAKAQVATCLATEILKRLTRERRPNGSDSLTSFPSGHTSAAFAMAGTLDAYKPQYKGLGYAVAGTIGWSRVEVRAHHWHDVIAGAILGSTIAHYFTHDPPRLAFQIKW